MSEERITTKRKLLVAAIFAIALLVFAVILHSWANEKTIEQHPSLQLPPQPKVAIVDITPHGFIPETLNIQPNTKVTWLNEDVKPHMPAADPYPSHTSLPNLISPMALGQKETYSFLFTKPGSVGYHDQINPTLSGKITIQK